MPSIAASAASWVIWWRYRTSRNQSSSEMIVNVDKNTVLNDTPEDLPSEVVQSDSVDAVRESSKLAGGQEWKVDHYASQGGRGDDHKVIVYWHGGAFVNRTSPFHQNFAHTLVKDTSIPVVLPHYTMAPLCTSTHSMLASLDFLLQLDSDPRYKDRETVLMGDSAGGWFVAQLLYLLTKISMGESIEDEVPGFGSLLGGDEGDPVEVLVRMRSRMKMAVMNAPLLECDMGSTDHPEDEDEYQPNDSWLNYQNCRLLGHLWAYGPTATPSHTYNLPTDAPITTHPQLAPSSSIPLTDARFSPGRHLPDLLERYHREQAIGRPFRILQMSGTYDILHPQALRMQDALSKLGAGVVSAELITEPGLFHVYPLVQKLPEAQRAIVKVEALLSEE